MEERTNNRLNFLDITMTLKDNFINNLSGFTNIFLHFQENTYTLSFDSLFAKKGAQSST